MDPTPRASDTPLEDALPEGEPEDWADDRYAADAPVASSPLDGPVADWREGVRTSGSRSLLVLLLTAALVVGGIWVVNRSRSSSTTAGKDGSGTTAVQLQQEGSGPAPEIGKVPQDFTATTVDGKPISLSSLKGKPVWLTFGASWCAACVAEAPDIEAAYTKAKANGTTVVAVFISEDAAKVKDYADRIGLTYPKIADPDDAIASAYRVSAIPAQFFIDKDGVLRSMKAGGLSPTQMDEALAAIGR